MDPALSLIISVLLILVLIRAGLKIGFSILCGAFLLGVLTVQLGVFNRMFITATSLPTIRLITLVISAFTLGYSMEYFKLLEKLTEAMSRISGRFSVLILPMIVGFLPMPGGALLSAVMLEKPVKKYNFSPEISTFYNYWYRHLWVPVWPLYPSFIIAAAIVEIGYTDFILATYPITVGAILSGILFTRMRDDGNDRISLNFKDIVTAIKSIYPILLVAVLALLFNLDLLFTIILSIILLYVHKKASFKDFIQILKKTLDYKVIILVFAVMVYKDLIIYTKAAEIFFTHLQTYNFSPAVAAFLLSFIVGFATGIELSYSSVALPMLTMFTGVADGAIPQNIMLVFGAGYLGVMVSPMHLCLALTAEYFKAKLNIVYRMLIPTSTILLILMIISYYLLGL